MNSFIIVFITIFGFITISDAQNLTSSIGKVETNENIIPLPFTVTVTNVQGTTSVSLSCAIILWTPGYSSAAISVSSPSNYVFTVTLSNLVVGRVSDIQCGLGNSSSASNVTIGLSVRPNIKAQVCADVSTVVVSGRPNTANVVVQFTYPLTAPATISCNLTGSKTASASVNAKTSPMTLEFNNNTSTTEVISCIFTMGTVTNSFQFNVNFVKAAISFSPNTIVTDAPLFTLNLFINFQSYQAQNLNCYAVSNTAGLTCGSPAYISMSNWNITASVSFPANDTTTVRTISLTKITLTAVLIENFEAVCCNDLYSAVAKVSFNHSIIDNSLQASTAPTTYSYIQFYQLSSCPCDLTVGACDLNCCCDPFCDCLSPNTAAITGPYGGFFNDIPRYSCQSPYQLTTDPYHALLCVQFNTSNIVGYYYNDTNLIQTTDLFQTSINSVNRNSFQFSLANEDKSSSKIVAYSASGTIPTFLYLPKQIVNSDACNLYNPVTLLQPYDSSCSYKVTSANCETLTDPRLSYANYLISNTAIENNCISSISLVNLNIPVYTFYSDITSSTWDNGYTLPNQTKLNTVAKTCDNVVKSVNYIIAYNSGGMVYINALVGLGSVPLDSSISQRFVVSFLSTNTPSNSLTNGSLLTFQNAVALSIANQTKTSGLYGYEDGLPVLLADGTTMNTFAPIVSGQCQKPISIRSVLFQKDSFMQCKYTFTNNDCANRRVELKAYLDSLLTNQSVAIYGNPSASSDYVVVQTILPPNLIGTGTVPFVNANISANVPINSMANYCESVTTGVSMIIYYSRQGKARGQYIHNIRGVKKSYVLGNLTNFYPSGNAKTDPIILTSMIEFVLVSANIQGALSTDGVAQRVCYFDVCIEELLYPWLLNYEGKQGFYELSFGVMLLGLAVLLLVTTPPWW